MKISFITFILLLATLVGVYCKQFDLPLVIIYQHWSIEVPMWLILTAALLCLSGFVAMYHLIASIYAGLFLIKYKRICSQHSRGLAQLQFAVIQLLEGKYAAAETAAITASKFLGDNFLSELTAAQAANAQGAWQQRDTYLQRAVAMAPEAALAIILQKTDLQITAKQYEACLATFAAIEQKGFKYKINTEHPKLLAIKSKLYIATQKFDELHSMLQRRQPVANKILRLLFNKNQYKNKPNNKTTAATQELQQLKETQILAYQELLINAANKYDYAHLSTIWQSIPSTFQQEEINLPLIYVKCLLKLNAQAAAEKFLRKQISQLQKKQLLLATKMHEQFFELYGLTAGDNISAQITFLEALLPEINNNATLLHALARLCIKQQLWGKARSYLQASINSQPSTTGYVELAKLLEQLGETKQSNECYKNGLLSIHGDNKVLSLN